MKKVLVLSVIVIMVMFAYMLPVNASQGEEVTLALSSEQANPGDTFYLSISQTSSQGIIGLEGTLQYDDNALELVGTEMKQGWADYGENALISAISNDPITSGEVCRVTFKVKEDVAVNQVSIGLVNVKVYRDYDDYNETTVEVVKVNVSGVNAQNELVVQTQVDSNLIIGIAIIIIVILAVVIIAVVKSKSKAESNEKE